jgi:small nuclear ribonucleoprotein (snRNP)-like protein
MNEECSPNPLMTRVCRIYLPKKSFLKRSLVNKYTLAISHLLAGLLIMSSTTVAQSASQNDPAWETVKALPYDESLTVKLKGGTTVDGTLISVSETNLKLYKTNQSPTSGIVYDDIVDLKKENILSIHRIEQKSGRQWTFIGAAAGAAVGVVAGAALTNIGGNCQSRPDVFGDVCGKAKTGFMVLGGLGGAATGATIGHLIGRKRLKRVLIYKSK